MEFAFHPDIPLDESWIQKMAKDVYEQGNKYWLIMRTAFNHMMGMVSRRPESVSVWATFIAQFAICREVRSLDSEIMLYKMNTLIP